MKKMSHGAGHHDHPEHHLHSDAHHEGRMHKEEMGVHGDHREKHGRGAMHEGARGAPHESGTNPGRGRENRRPWASGSDAAYIEPKLIPDFELLARDDSGGPEWAPYTQEWGDGGYVTGEKAHLSAHGGRDDDMEGDEISGEPRMRAARQGRPLVSPSRRAPGNDERD